MNEDSVLKLYSTDEYIRRDPSLSEGESEWKASKIIPLVERYISMNERSAITVLDVGGGVGSILRLVSDYIAENHRIPVCKMALDLSPGGLEAQKRRNPDLEKCLNEDIRYTSLANKEVDLALLIDVLEHVPNPSIALHELSRISRYAVLKVPLERNLYYALANLILIGGLRKKQTVISGHINFYNLRGLVKQVECHCGEIVSLSFANLYGHFRSSADYYNLPPYRRVPYLLQSFLFGMSPEASSWLVPDHAMLLIKCR